MNLATGEAFEFDNVLHAQRLVIARLSVIKKMTDFNGNFSDYEYLSLPDHPQAESNSSYWEPNPDNKALFRQKTGNAYDAIIDLNGGIVHSYGECFGATVACVWWGVAQGMTRERTNAQAKEVFNSMYPGTNALVMFQNEDTSSWFSLVPAVDLDTLIPGDRLAIVNSTYEDAIKCRDFYEKNWILPPESRMYYWSNLNCIYIGDGKYSGLGKHDMDFSTIRDQMMSNYNQDLATLQTALSSSAYRYPPTSIFYGPITNANKGSRIYRNKLRRITLPP